MSQRSFLVAFRDRREDVRRYMAALVLAERDAIRGGPLARHDAELRMFKAGGMLVLYNAVEASARSGIEAIYDELSLNNASFDDLRDTIKKRVVRDFKSNFSADNGHSLGSLAVDIISRSFNPSELFSGNVDARVLKQKALEYGFSTDSEYKRTSHGADLVTVKNHRNDLAHGLVSFGEVGRDYLATDLYKLSGRVLNYMEAVLLQIDQYLDEGGYIA